MWNKKRKRKEDLKVSCQFYSFLGTSFHVTSRNINNLGEIILNGTHVNRRWNLIPFASQKCCTFQYLLVLIEPTGESLLFNIKCGSEGILNLFFTTIKNLRVQIFKIWTFALSFNLGLALMLENFGCKYMVNFLH